MPVMYSYSHSITKIEYLFAIWMFPRGRLGVDCKTFNNSTVIGPYRQTKDRIKAYNEETRILNV